MSRSESSDRVFSSVVQEVRGMLSVVRLGRTKVFANSRNRFVAVATCKIREAVCCLAHFLLFFHIRLELRSD